LSTFLSPQKLWSSSCLCRCMQPICFSGEVWGCVHDLCVKG
jgi:hypothetical protein